MLPYELIPDFNKKHYHRENKKRFRNFQNGKHIYVAANRQDGGD